MGCCLSKNDPSSKSVPSLSETHQKDPQKIVCPLKSEQPKKQIAAIETNPKEANEKTEERDEGKEVLAKKKKEVFVIQHRKSNDKRELDSDRSASNSSDSNKNPEELGRNLMAAAASGQAVRTSSCTKEEVDAILIQCGRLSRSSSGKGGNVVGHGRRYSGSKRSFDFDKENEIAVNGNDDLIEVNNDEVNCDERSRRHRQSRGSHRRRATLSRSRERDQTPQQQRSGSKERSQSNGRRVSRSPGRRSESPIISHSGNINSNNNSNSNCNGNVRPGKLISVPAIVTSLSVDNGNGGDGGNVKRVLVKRNVGSPRSQSPARTQSPGKGANHGNGGQQVVSLSRNGSRKAEHSPYRRTPLNEIDVNSLPFHPLSNKKGSVQKGKEIEEDVAVVKQPVISGFQNKLSDTNNVKASTRGTHRRTSSRGAEGFEVTKTNYCRVNEHQTPSVEQMTTDIKREQFDPSEYDAMVMPVVVLGTDTTLKLPQTLIRSRSGRRSRDLDINVESLLAPNPTTNYNSLLLQDIQNFHQKKSSNSNANSCNNAVSSNIDSSTSPFVLPACVSKACSIIEAVTDLNSTNVGSNLKSSREPNFSFDNPFVESEVKVGDDLMEPSIHKYVTVRKRGGDMDDEESSGSNSIVGGGCQQHLVSSSSWEPTSADSTDCWTSKSCSREEASPVGFQRHAISDFGCGTHEESERKSSKAGVARTRAVASRGPIPASKPGAGSI